MCRSSCCISVALYFLSALFTLFLGLVLGSAFAATFLAIQTWLIIGTVVFFVAAVVTAIVNICKCNRCDR